MKIIYDYKIYHSGFVRLILDLFLTTKPKIVVMLVLTLIVGMCLSDNMTAIPLDTFLKTILGFFCIASSAASINHLIDYNYDKLMSRTLNRPLVKGTVTRKSLFTFNFILVFSGTITLLSVNLITTFLSLFGFLGYTIIYSKWLKHKTHQNIVIGGLSGAIPPLVGWTAVTNDIHPYSLLLVMIIFLWTPPHFWPLAIFRRSEYQLAGIPMLPVTHGNKFTSNMIIFYTIMLFCGILFTWVVGMTGQLFIIFGSILSLIFLIFSILLRINTSFILAKITFIYSIIYLFCIFALLFLDKFLQ
ncbi:heme o synthase [Paraphotobacterium marinum]|uniref:heme o synthase n=1 Tax=Paraphotobacterium marinum TaxID=1755811 RepID=UPI0039EADE80